MNQLPKLANLVSLTLALLGSAFAASITLKSALSVATFPVDTAIACLAAFALAIGHILTRILEPDDKFDFGRYFKGPESGETESGVRAQFARRIWDRHWLSLALVATPMFLWWMSGYRLSDVRTHCSSWAEDREPSYFRLAEERSSGELWWVQPSVFDEAGETYSSQLFGYEPIADVSETRVVRRINGQNIEAVEQEFTVRAAREIAGEFHLLQVLNRPTDPFFPESYQAPPLGDANRFVLRSNSSLTSVELVEIQVRVTSHERLARVNGVEIGGVAAAVPDDLFIVELNPNMVGEGFLPASKFGSTDHRYSRQWFKGEELLGITLIAYSRQPATFKYDIEAVTRSFGGNKQHVRLATDVETLFTHGPQNFDAAYVIPHNSDLLMPRYSDLSFRLATDTQNDAPPAPTPDAMVRPKVDSSSDP